MKNIWMFNHYATKPDEPKTRGYDLGRELIKKGYSVTIFASSFSHYRLEEKYLKRGEKYKIEDYNGVKFVWIRTFPYSKNDWKRFLNMFSFSWRAFWISVKMKERPDLIIGTCVHPFAVLSAYYVSKIKKSRFFFEITDLWPQNLVDLGFLSARNPLVKLAYLLESFLLSRAEKIIIIPPNIGDYLDKKKVSKEKIVWIPNGLDLSFYDTMKDYDGGEEGRLVCMYSGIFSRYAGLEIIVEAAKILQDDKQENIKILLLGGGAEKERLFKIVERYGLKNLEFIDMVPREKVLSYYENVDVFISIIKDIVSSVGVSSKKLNDYMAAGRPVIFAVNSKNNPIEDAKAGFTVKPENPKELAEAMKKMAEISPMERSEMGRRAKRYAEENLDIKVLAAKLEKLI